MVKKKTPRGAGYTVRVGGRKYLTASLLEEQVEAAQQQLEELTKQNEVLRSKEAKHMEALETVEAVLHTLGSVAEQPVPGTKQHAKWLEAVLLDMQALTLKQELQQLNPDAPTPLASLAASAGVRAPSTQAGSEPTCSNSTCSSIATPRSDATSGASMGGSSSSSGDNPHSSSQHRVTRLLASLTPAEIMEFKGLTVPEVAGRFKAGKIRLEQARTASLAAGSDNTPELDAAAAGYARLCLLSLVSDESRHCQVIGLNLETMQQETMSDQYYSAVVDSAQMQPAQVQQVCVAFRIFCKVEGELMQQQQEVMQQLQQIMGQDLPKELVASAFPSAGLIPQGGAPAAAAAGHGPGQRKLPPGAALAALQSGVSADSPAANLSPQLQHLLKLRAKAAAKAAAAAAKEAAAAGADSASGIKQQPGVGDIVPSGGSLPVGTAASMPRTSSRRGGKGHADKGNAQQLPPSGALPAGQPCSSRPGSGSGSGSGRSSMTVTTTEVSRGSTPASSGSSMSAKELLSGGVLSVEVSEKVEELLESLMRVGWNLKHNGRNLATTAMNVVSSAQYADTVVAAWPYFISPQRFCAIVAQVNSEVEEATP